MSDRAREVERKSADRDGNKRWTGGAQNNEKWKQREEDEKKRHHR